MKLKYIIISSHIVHFLLKLILVNRRKGQTNRDIDGVLYLLPKSDKYYQWILDQIPLSIPKLEPVPSKIPNSDKLGTEPNRVRIRCRFGYYLASPKQSSVEHGRIHRRPLLSKIIKSYFSFGESLVQILIDPVRSGSC